MAKNQTIIIYFKVFPWILLASCISFGKLVTCLACITHRLVSSNRQIKYDSATSCMARTALACMQCQACSLCSISLTNRKNDIFRMRSLVVFWNLLISLRALVLGLYLLDHVLLVLVLPVGFERFLMHIFNFFPLNSSDLFLVGGVGAWS